MSTSGAPILVSNTSLQSEEPWLLEEVADSRAGAESIEDEPGNFCNVKSKKVLKKKKITTIVGICQRDTGANQKSSKWPTLEQSEQQNK